MVTTRPNKPQFLIIKLTAMQENAGMIPHPTKIAFIRAAPLSTAISAHAQSWFFGPPGTLCRFVSIGFRRQSSSELSEGNLFDGAGFVSGRSTWYISLQCECLRCKIVFPGLMPNVAANLTSKRKSRARGDDNNDRNPWLENSMTTYLASKHLRR
jgi:hypothetical protein